MKYCGRKSAHGAMLECIFYGNGRPDIHGRKELCNNKEEWDKSELVSDDECPTSARIDVPNGTVRSSGTVLFLHDTLKEETNVYSLRKTPMCILGAQRQQQSLKIVS